MGVSWVCQGYVYSVKGCAKGVQKVHKGHVKGVSRVRVKYERGKFGAG